MEQIGTIHAKYNPHNYGSCIISAYEHSTQKLMGRIPLYLSSYKETTKDVWIRFRTSEHPNVKTVDDIELKVCVLHDKSTIPFDGEIIEILYDTEAK